MQVQLIDIFTREELKAITRIWAEVGGTTKLHERLCDYIQPLMKRIDEKTKQENSIHYLAYVLEYALNETATGR
jgi:hypothetical protein